MAQKNTPKKETAPVEPNPAKAAAKPVPGGFFNQTQGIIWLCVMLAAAALWTFWPALNGDFIFYDDYGTLNSNDHVNKGLTWAGVTWALTATDFNQWIPLAWVSHMLDFQFYGTNPWGHHLTNVLIHAASCVALFLMLRRMTGALWRSFIVAAIFALHPLRVESVAWVSERKDVLSVFFGFLALWAYAEYVLRQKANQGRTTFFYWLTYFLFACSLLSKQTLVTFPCLLWVLDFWPFDRWKPGNFQQVIIEKVPFLIVLPFVSKLSYYAQLRGGALQEMAWLPWDAKLENAIVSYAKYVADFFWPANLSIFYAHPGYWPGELVLWSAVLLVVVSVAAFLFRRETPYVFTGWFWFIGTMVPMLGFVQLYSLAMADRFTYMPCVGTTIAVVWGLYALTRRLPNQAMIGTVATALVLVACTAQTRHLIGFWKDNETVLHRAEAVDPNNYVAPADLGYLYSISPGGAEAAFQEYQKSAAIYPRFIQSQYFVGDGLLQRGQINQAMAHLFAGLLIDPNHPRCLFDMGVAYFQKGKTNMGIDLCKKALSLDPGNVQFNNSLGVMLAQLNRFSEAVPMFQKLCAAAPNNPNAWNTLGIVLARSGQFDDAINAFQTALKFAPGDASLQANLNAAIQAKQQPPASSPAGASTNQPAAH